ncbi:hypothetical protein IF1G_09223 [Cordyceps javanica]|uniref:Uncharacterized protein n=1 Tax=Cordyceps javanica TaxID=43265 RepID=A0A545URR0_9HYPO|nr:hypothetical protein IF1G_09223 [Cordyceps javanica]
MRLLSTGWPTTFATANFEQMLCLTTVYGDKGLPRWELAWIAHQAGRSAAIFLFPLAVHATFKRSGRWLSGAQPYGLYDGFYIRKSVLRRHCTACKRGHGSSHVSTARYNSMSLPSSRPLGCHSVHHGPLYFSSVKRHFGSAGMTVRPGTIS